MSKSWTCLAGGPAASNAGMTDGPAFHLTTRSLRQSNHSHMKHETSSWWRRTNRSDIRHRHRHHPRTHWSKKSNIHDIVIIIILDPSLHHWTIPIHLPNRWYHWSQAWWTISTTFTNVVVVVVVAIMLWDSRLGWIWNNHYQTRYGRQMSWICIRLLSFQWISNHLCWSSE